MQVNTIPWGNILLSCAILKTIKVIWAWFIMFIVQTIKNLMKKCNNGYLGLLMYNNTPLANGLLIGRWAWNAVSKPVSPAFQNPSYPTLLTSTFWRGGKWNTETKWRGTATRAMSSLLKTCPLVSTSEALTCRNSVTSSNSIRLQEASSSRSWVGPYPEELTDDPQNTPAKRPSLPEGTSCPRCFILVTHSPSFPYGQSWSMTSQVLCAALLPDLRKGGPIAGGTSMTPPIKSVTVLAQAQQNLPSTELAAPALNPAWDQRMPTYPKNYVYWLWICQFDSFLIHVRFILKREDVVSRFVRILFG